MTNTVGPETGIAARPDEYDTWSPAMGVAAADLASTGMAVSDANVAVATVMSGRPWRSARAGLPGEPVIVQAIVDAWLDFGPEGLTQLLSSPNLAVREAALLGMAA